MAVLQMVTPCRELGSSWDCLLLWSHAKPHLAMSLTRGGCSFACQDETIPTWHCKATSAQSAAFWTRRHHHYKMAAVTGTAHTAASAECTAVSQAGVLLKAVAINAGVMHVWRTLGMVWKVLTRASSLRCVSSSCCSDKPNELCKSSIALSCAAVELGMMLRYYRQGESTLYAVVSLSIGSLKRPPRKVKPLASISLRL